MQGTTSLGDLGCLTPPTLWLAVVIWFMNKSQSILHSLLAIRPTILQMLRASSLLGCYVAPLYRSPLAGTSSGVTAGATQILLQIYLVHITDLSYRVLEHLVNQKAKNLIAISTLLIVQ